MQSFARSECYTRNSLWIYCNGKGKSFCKLRSGTLDWTVAWSRRMPGAASDVGGECSGTEILGVLNFFVF